MLNYQGKCDSTGIMNDNETVVEQVRGLQRRLGRLLRPTYPDILKNVPLTIPQLRSLFFIARKKCTSPGQLAEGLGVSPSAITSVVDCLVRQGLVQRYENPENRRMLCLEVTAQGEALISNLVEVRLTKMNEVLARLSEEEINVLIQALQALVRAAEELDESSCNA